LNKRLNILFLQTDFPFPVTGGGRLRSFHLLKELAKTNNVSLVSFADSSITTADVQEMKQYCRRVEAVSFDVKHSAFKYLKSLFTGIPYRVLLYSSSEFAAEVRTTYAEESFDLVFSEHPYLAQHIPPGAKCVIAQKDEMMATILKRTAESGSFIMRLYARTQWKKMWKYEIDLYRRYGVFIAISREDQKLVNDLVPGIKIPYISNGVDTDFYSPHNEHEDENGLNIVFTGVYSYYPNEQGALFFVQEILPLIRIQYPAIRFFVVGKEPPQSVRNMSSDPSITVTGLVADIRPYIQRASVVVVPLLIGGGTRNKILEAMAMGKAIVSTSIGAEGLEVHNGKDILIADSPQDFANSVMNLLADKEKRRALGNCAREMVLRDYRWEAVGTTLDSFIREFVEEKKGKKDSVETKA
jgi:polysaccharide biosynthesis protein PslH